MTPIKEQAPAPGMAQGAEDTDDANRLPPEFEEVLDYRRAARAIVRRDDLSHRDRTIALVRLVEQARREAALRAAAQLEIAREGLEFIRTGEVPSAPPTGDPVIRANRILLGKGLSTCPQCRRFLPSEDQLDRWEAKFSAALADYAISSRPLDEPGGENP